MLDAGQKNALPIGTDLSEIGIPGSVCKVSPKVCSRNYGEGDFEAYILGIGDLLVELHEGGFAIVDLKSAQNINGIADAYKPQLSAYALALVEPDRGPSIDVRKAYVLACWPQYAAYIPDSKTMMLSLGMQSVDVPIEPEEARARVRKIVLTITSPQIPLSGEHCEHCAYARSLMKLAKDLKECESASA